MARTPRPSRIAFTIAAALLGGALVWWTIAVPWLVRYPTDVDVSPAYVGEFTLLVDPATMAPSAEPMTLPMTIDRRIEADGDESGADRVLVREDIHQQVGGGLVDLRFENTYVMDRRSLKNVADGRAWAFAPTNPVDRAGAYRLHLPFGTDRDASYHMYKNEVDATYPMEATGEVVEREGLTLTEYAGSMRDAQVAPAFLAELRRAAPLPETMTRDQLAAFGIPVSGPGVVPLEYVWSFDGAVLVERSTGSEVVVAAEESLGVRPVLDGIADVPTIGVFRYTFDQTKASVADIADEVRDQRRLVLVVEQWVPLALLAVGLVALAVGVVEWPPRRRRRRVVAAPSPV